ncbi:uncharacterized protein F5891DRAFT_1189731 [Suillus fuscotomentosus]|uniref:Uncharacterized protein n=1 Tax=Suillus fuscotomentosus TaxID=1912939 RepID=A0AAD4E4J9_9AGAM|nr:uncharacterized protein F5891DRAFT_1189731 [Suillus fuscotomentosus]KAG1899571.1 hypothetical protein F5891DRAFT_1189731 [Suillus fuscotomentosus]
MSQRPKALQPKRLCRILLLSRCILLSTHRMSSFIKPFRTLKQPYIFGAHQPPLPNPTTFSDQPINPFLELSTSLINSEESARSSLDKALELSSDFPSILDEPSLPSFKLLAARFLPFTPSVPPLIDATRNIASAVPLTFIRQNNTFPPVQTQPLIPTVPNTPIPPVTLAPTIINPTPAPSHLPSSHITSTKPSMKTVVSTSNKGIAVMPGPGSNKAPSFNGETSELVDFFELFEDLATSCTLTDEQKCKAIVCYTDVLTKCFWVMLTGYESKDFMIFKQSILAKYLHANQGTHYMIRDLERVVLNTVDSDISTETELLQYYCQFHPIAVWLETNSKISQRE